MTGPVIAVALVLCAVFVPCAFISGITGRFFRQFAVTIAVSTVFSAINSLTLSPALAAILLRKKDRGPTEQTQPQGIAARMWRPASRAMGLFSRGFNAAFGRTTAGYAWSVGKLLHVNVVVLLAYAALLALTFGMFRQSPRGFVPQQDQGRIIVERATSRRRVAGADAGRVGRRSTRSPGRPPAWPTRLRWRGYSFVQQANGPNFASMFIVLKPFNERTTPELRDTAIMNSLRRQWTQKIKEAQVLVFGSPPIPGLSVAGGFKLIVEDRAGLGLPILERQTNAVVDKLSKEPGLVAVSIPVPLQHAATVHGHRPDETAALGVPFIDVEPDARHLSRIALRQQLQRLRPSLAGQYPGRGRLPQPRSPTSICWQVRNNQGQMVPLGTLAEHARDRRSDLRQPLQPRTPPPRSPAACGRASVPAT